MAGSDGSERPWWDSLEVGDVARAGQELAQVVAHDAAVDAARVATLWRLLLHLGETERMGAILDEAQRRLAAAESVTQRWLEVQQAWLREVAAAAPPASERARADYAPLAERVRDLDSRMESAWHSIERRRMKPPPKLPWK